LPYWLWSGDAFWSPDSQSIAFPTSGNRLMRMRLPKGAQELVTTIPGEGNRGGSWGDNGTIIYAVAENGLFSVPASGGTAQPLEVPGLKEGSYYSPEFLPGGEDFLFTFVSADSGEARVFLASLRGAKIVNPQSLFSNETSAAFTPAGGGRILFVRGDNLYSQKLDLKARKLSGDPELVQEHVASFAGVRLANFSISREGTTVWRPGTAVVSQVTVFRSQGEPHRNRRRSGRHHPNRSFSG
jgi:hypothetical protein